MLTERQLEAAELERHYLTIIHDFVEGEFCVGFGDEIVATAIQQRDGGLFHVYFHRLFGPTCPMMRKQNGELIGAVWSKSGAVALVANRMVGGL